MKHQNRIFQGFETIQSPDIEKLDDRNINYLDFTDNLSLTIVIIVIVIHR